MGASNLERQVVAGWLLAGLICVGSFVIYHRASADKPLAPMKPFVVEEFPGLDMLKTEVYTIDAEEEIIESSDAVSLRNHRAPIIQGEAAQALHDNFAHSAP